ncbi:MAG: VTT domain-containing protein [Thermoprotei archaeon]
MSIEEWLEIFIERYGLLGIFLVSFIGNAIPYSTIPYLLLIILYSGLLSDSLQQALLVIISGFGAAMGKLVVYMFGYGISRVLPEKTRKNLELFTEVFRKSTFIAVYLFAALPLPDDILYVPLGATRYSVVKYFIALVLGKITITALAVFFGSATTSYLREAMGLPPYISIPILLVITLYIMYLVAVIDWNKATSIAMKKGLAETISYVLRSAWKATREIPARTAGFLRRVVK